MLKKKRKLQTFDNVVLFPGTIENMLTEAHTYAEHGQYERANDRFEQVLAYIEPDEATLRVYAYSLYEVRNYTRAKEVCEDLLALGPIMYFEIMELYLTVCMQLKQFQQVEKVINTLLQEGVIPEERIEKFTRLKELNAEIAEKKRQQEEERIVEESPSDFSVAHFLQQQPEQQLMLVHNLTLTNVRPIARQLKEIIEHPNTLPFIKSLVLIVLVEQEVQLDIAIEKLERKMVINPATLHLPTKLPQFQVVSQDVTTQLEQDPSALELIYHLLAKHAIVAYPFEWLDYDSTAVANAYVAYVRQMFGAESEAGADILAFIEQLEKWSEMQDM